MKVNELVFHYVHLLYYKCYKMNPNQGESYVDSRDWKKNKKAAKNTKKKKKKKIMNFLNTLQQLR